jgi:hypothetical protein
MAAVTAFAAGGRMAATGQQTNSGIAIDPEDKATHRKLMSICRGCGDRRRATGIERITSRSPAREC